MSEQLYNSLFDTAHDHPGDHALVAAFAQLGRLRNAANQLANDEMHDGMWVVEEESAEYAARYAADDRTETNATYSGNGYSVTIALDDATWTATQVAGQPGASLKMDGNWIALTPNERATLGISELPTELVLVDLAGRETILKR